MPCTATMRPVLPGVHELSGMEPEPRREHAVGGHRRAAALHVSEHGHAGLEAGAALDLGAKERADPAEPHEAVLVELVGGEHLVLLTTVEGQTSALGHDHDRESLTASVPGADHARDLVDGALDLWHEDAVRATGQSGGRGEPARVAAHDLDDHDPVVRLRGGAQAIDRIRRHLDGRVESERAVRADHVVVDGLRDAHDREAVRVELASDVHGVLAADRDERVERVVLLRRPDGLDPAVMAVRVVAGRLQDRAAELQDAGEALVGERHPGVGITETAVATQQTDGNVAVLVQLSSGAADHGVEPRAVAAGGQDPTRIPVFYRDARAPMSTTCEPSQLLAKRRSPRERDRRGASRGQLSRILRREHRMQDLRARVRREPAQPRGREAERQRDRGAFHAAHRRCKGREHMTADRRPQLTSHGADLPIRP